MPKFTEETTAEEIWSDTDGQVDIMVAGRHLALITVAEAKHGSQSQAISEPANSPVLSGGRRFAQNPGHWAGFTPSPQS